MFLGLAIICDDYFVASLEQIVEVSLFYYEKAMKQAMNNCIDLPGL